MVPILLSLPFLLGPAIYRETPGAGPYSLTFLYMGLSKPSRLFPKFQATAFLNDQAFFHYNSDSRKAEPLGPWRQIKGMEDWEKESQLQKAREEIFLVTLKDIMDYYKDREGSHTFQGMFGCEIQNNRSSGAFWRYAYDGKDFIEFNKEIPAWVPLDPAAKKTKQKWEAEKVYVQRAKAYLEEECPRMLRRYLNYSKTHLDRQDPPSVSVTGYLVPGKNKTLKCLAYDFYPQGIGLRWIRTGMKQESGSRVDVLPSGNGTYQSWVVAEVPLQDRGPHFCLVEHSGLAQSLTVPWEEKQKTRAKGSLESQPQQSPFLPDMKELNSRNHRQFHQQEPKEAVQTQGDLETEDLNTWS
ncbi:PREDICTED: zinc-alpha-2-glycoprotein isoform X2 [Chinchilla lanigera]|uniref:Alpha-2-glycoprotein 1, zinc-binding n=2 Tax=Chinchilla lanigera TaxID=34839 RepID=A0A8C2UL33_CHILA|nr:PREDICTED: zinc-alpha-2-glycoprotein isoform X2 [Chinchilla lanigera]